MGCLFTKKDPLQQSAELNEVHLQIKNRPKDGPISTENPSNRSHGNGSCVFISIFPIVYLNV